MPIVLFLLPCFFSASGQSICSVRSLVLCFPNNPVGSTLTAVEAQELAAYLDRKLTEHPESDFSVVLDEVYLGLNEQGAHHSILSYASPKLLANCMLVLSVSKGLGAMPGGRGGFLTVFSKSLAKELTKIQMACTANCCSIAQVGLQASLRHILDHPEAITSAFEYYKERTTFCVKRLNEIGAKYFSASSSGNSLVAKQPAGTFYVLASFAGWSCMEDDRSIQRLLRDQYRLNPTRGVGVACVPGCAFNLDPKLKLIRFSCAVEMEVLTQAMDIIEEAIQQSIKEQQQ